MQVESFQGMLTTLSPPKKYATEHYIVLFSSVCLSIIYIKLKKNWRRIPYYLNNIISFEDTIIKLLYFLVLLGTRL